ncbi:uncharacterized protein LOC112890644 [Panicum hallii]|uniref:uncharacterized protein LOC112890644 n=1 Tax=Panicum hallii TaxID=206008 RepID=UPI000DF4CB0D|nr:uncharacterized protein LOC112890644 [Panicum hallii]
MRTDRKGYLHMYPDLGGPFGSFQEAEAAINRYLDERRLLEMYNFYTLLYLHLSIASIGQFNPHPSFHPTHELKDFVSWDWVYENAKTYYHFNFTTKANKADDVNLFFAEVMWIKIGYAVTCCCVITPNDHGCCYGCTSTKQKIIHPNNNRAYIGGHVWGNMPFGGDDSSDDEDDEAFVARLRFFLRGSEEALADN